MCQFSKLKNCYSQCGVRLLHNISIFIFFVYFLFPTTVVELLLLLQSRKTSIEPVDQ